MLQEIVLAELLQQLRLEQAGRLSQRGGTGHWAAKHNYQVSKSSDKAARWLMVLLYLPQKLVPQQGLRDRAHPYQRIPMRFPLMHHSCSQCR